MTNPNDVYQDDDLQRLYNDEYFAPRSRPTMWNRRAEFIVEKFNPNTTLDIGCAYGELVKSLCDQGIDAFGVDGSEYAISQCDKSIQKKLFKVNLNSDKFPFPEKYFDVITSFYSVEHIHDIEFFSKEIWRTLKDDGIIWFLTPDEGPEARDEIDVFTNKFEDWKKIFEKFDFKVEQFSPHQMMALKGKLGKFRFYKLPKSVQNTIKHIAYNYANKKMNDTSFTLVKKQ